jgi:hypothetical protein
VDGVLRVVEEALGEQLADEAGGSGDEDVHGGGWECSFFLEAAERFSLLAWVWSFVFKSDSHACMPVDKASSAWMLWRVVLQ